MAAYGTAGKADEVKAGLAEARRLNPGITIKPLKEHTTIHSERNIEDMRKAGVPEG